MSRRRPDLRWLAIVLLLAALWERVSRRRCWKGHRDLVSKPRKHYLRTLIVAVAWAVSFLAAVLDLIDRFLS